MKKIKLPISLFLTIIVFACKGEKQNGHLGPGIKTENKVVFEIDERTEFFRTIFNIAVQDVLPEDIRPCQTEYLKRVNRHFLQYKNHPLINWVYEDDNIGIDFSTIGLMFKNLRTFEFDTTYTKELEYYGLNTRILDSVKPLMIDFYKKSNFNEFYKSNGNYYNQAISQIEKQVLDEKLFDKVMDFYQIRERDMELIVFVELTNSANNKAINFYDNYNTKKRAIILANYCELYTELNLSNEIMQLDNPTRGVLYHEISHLVTNKLLEEHIGESSQYNSICEGCNDIEITDKVDHMIVYPLQAIMMGRFDKNSRESDFYLTKCTDVRKEIYQRLTEYRPEDKVAFEKTYIDCMDLIKESASE
ncbi:MAG: hypothetical protein CR994_03415 [Maribacter sp.]|nr:MAG: hypothetical protein CR994_03415 [Maribacter sp.]